MRITVAGAGYVGLSLAVLLAQKNAVTAVTTTPAKAELINSGISPIQDEEISRFLAEKKLSLRASTDREAAYRDAELIIIATPTDYDPEKNFFDTSAVEDVIGSVMRVNPAAVMVINQKFFISGFKSLWHKAPNMDTLVALGSTASFVYSVYALFAMTGAQVQGDMDAVMSYMHEFYFESAAMILTLITVGKMLESISKGKTTDALKSLMKLAPKTAVLLRDGKEVEVGIDQVKKGDHFIVRPGENIPVDGVVVEGIDNCPIKFAKCCSPLPGDDIIGFVTRGFGVSIHKQSCVNAISSMKDPTNAPRWVKAYWADSVKDSYKAGLEIVALDRNELLRDVLSALADIRVPIYTMNARQVENNCAVVSLTIGINNTEHLNRVVARLSKVKDVLKVTRS